MGKYREKKSEPIEIVKLRYEYFESKRREIWEQVKQRRKRVMEEMSEDDKV